MPRAKLRTLLGRFARRGNRPASIALGAVATTLLMVGVLALPSAGAIETAGPDSAAVTAAAPVRAAFYYPWFPETEHWATHYTPSLGKYDSSVRSLVDTQVSQARYAGLDAFISSYWGRNTKTAQRLPLLLDAARGQDFHIAPYYEPESQASPPTAAALQADFDSLSALADDSAWLRVGGKPVLFTYNTGREGTCAGLDRILSASGGRFYINAKVFAGYTSCASQPDSWHQYGPAAAYDQQGTLSATVSPGFYKYNESEARLPRQLARFQTDLARQTASGAQWQLVTTFNEWGEGTSVEPATQWSSPSGMGDYLDAMRSAYLGSSTPSTSSTPSPSPTTVMPSPSASPSPSATSTPAVSVPITKILTVVVENHSLDQMKVGMPYTYGLAQQYGYASNWTAIRHPSLPNYLAMAGGSTYGVTDDANPASHVIAGPSVFGAALAAGRTAKVYQEGMSTPCQGTSSGRYAPKHNAWAYFAEERGACQALDIPSGTSSSGALRTDLLSGNLPAVAEVTPDLCNDAHDCSLATADSWLRNWMTVVFAGPDWRSGQLAVIVTADEDNGSQGNRVLTAVIHPSQDHHVVTTPLGHYSWTRLMTDLVGAPCIGAGCTAADAAVAFGLPLR